MVHISEPSPNDNRKPAPSSAYTLKSEPGTPMAEKEWDDIAAAIALELKTHMKTACVKSPATLADFQLLLHETITAYENVAQLGVGAQSASDRIRLSLARLAHPTPAAKARIEHLGI